MHKIIVRLLSDRAYAGQLHIENQAGKVLVGPFPVCGRADDKLAQENKNPDRNPLLPFGDTPLGEYEVRQIIKSGKGTFYPEEEFGSAGVVLLQPKQGDAALADANGRFGFFIQGGRLARHGLLRPADGSLRLSNSQQQKLVRILRLIGETDCQCVVLNDGRVKKGRKVTVAAASVESSGRPLLKKMLLAGRLSISIPSILMMSTNATFSQATSGDKGTVLRASRDSFSVPDKLAFSMDMASSKYAYYSGYLPSRETPTPSRTSSRMRS